VALHCEFRKALPELTEQQAVCSYLFALGARQQAQAMARRRVRLMGEGARGEDISPEPFMLLFVAAGISEADNAAQIRRVR
jgi:hypothetical protein